MRKTLVLMALLAVVLVVACNKKEEDDQDRIKLLTGVTWVADSLLANGADASGPGQTLEKFKGEAKFNADGTGTFGEYTGTWSMSSNQQEVTIIATELLLPVIARIQELTETSLKITTSVPDQNVSPPVLLDIRMTFKAK